MDKTEGFALGSALTACLILLTAVFYLHGQNTGRAMQSRDCLMKVSGLPIEGDRELEDRLKFLCEVSDLD